MNGFVFTNHFKKCTEKVEPYKNGSPQYFNILTFFRPVVKVKH